MQRQTGCNDKATFTGQSAGKISRGVGPDHNVDDDDRPEVDKHEHQRRLAPSGPDVTKNVRPAIRNLQITQEKNYTLEAMSGDISCRGGIAKRQLYRGTRISHNSAEEYQQVTNEISLRCGIHGLKDFKDVQTRPKYRQTQNATAKQDVPPPHKPKHIWGQASKVKNVMVKQIPKRYEKAYKVKETPTPVFNYLRRQLPKGDTGLLPPIAVHGDGFSKQGSSTKSNSLRHIIIDGSSVAFVHGHHRRFSAGGIITAVNYFQSRGHKVSVILSKSSKKNFRSLTKTEQETLQQLEGDGVLVLLPSRKANSLYCDQYENRVLLRLAVETEGIIVSNNQFDDLKAENLTWKQVIAERLLMFTFAGNIFLPLEDPLGRNGLSLDRFLRKT